MPTTNALTLCLWKDYFDQHLTNNGGHKAFWDAERVLQQQEEEEAEREERDESMGEKGHSAALTKPSMEGRWSGPSRGDHSSLSHFRGHDLFEFSFSYLFLR